MTDELCDRFNVVSAEPESGSFVGIAIQTLSERPIHGLRHNVEGTSNGWYFWCGDWSDADDFFQPLHLEHLADRLPRVQKFLTLPPGFRFLVDDEGYEDIWFDESLLNS
jgi:hypothetical protein